jgi:hypothetical protein
MGKRDNGRPWARLGKVLIALGIAAGVGVGGLVLLVQDYDSPTKLQVMWAQDRSGALLPYIQDAAADGYHTSLFNELVPLLDEDAAASVATFLPTRSGRRVGGFSTDDVVWAKEGEVWTFTFRYQTTDFLVYKRKGGIIVTWSDPREIPDIQIVAKDAVKHKFRQ